MSAPFSSPAARDYTLSNLAPRMLYIPKRCAELDYCYVAVGAVISIYCAGTIVFLELSNHRTLRLGYHEEAQAEQAVSHFHFAMSVFVSKEDANREWPKPISGSIMRMV